MVNMHLCLYLQHKCIDKPTKTAPSEPTTLKYSCVADGINAGDPICIRYCQKKYTSCLGEK